MIAGGETFINEEGRITYIGDAEQGMNINTTTSQVSGDLSLL